MNKQQYLEVVSNVKEIFSVDEEVTICAMWDDTLAEFKTSELKEVMPHWFKSN